MIRTLTFYFFIIIIVTNIRGQWDILNEGGSFGTIDFINDDIGWIVGEGEFYKTEDGGDTWNKIFVVNDIAIARIDFLNESVGWAISYDDYILKSLDGGNTWFIQKQFTNYNMLAIQVVNDSTVYISAVANDYPKFLKTVDGGINWTTITRNEYNREYQLMWFQDIDNGFFIGSEDGGVQSVVLRTNDGGTTFNEEIIFQDKYIFDIQTLNDSTAYFLCRESGGPKKLCYTNDTLNNKTILTTNFDFIYSFYCLDEATVFAVVRDSTLGFIKSTDGGITWHSRRPVPFHYGFWPSSWFKYDLLFKNNNIGYIAGEGFGGSFLSKTIDGGSAWYIQKFGIPTSDIFFIDRNKGFVCGGKSAFGPLGPIAGHILVTEDGGNSWIESGSYGNIAKVFFVDSLIGYTISHGGGGWWKNDYIHKTTDGGISWEVKNEGSAGDIVFRDAQLGWHIGWYHDTTAIVETTDGGDNWESIWEKPSYGETSSLRALYDIEGTLWAVGDSGLILHSVNPDSFKKIYGVTSLNLYNVFFSDGQHGWICAGDSLSKIFKTNDGGQSWYVLPLIGYNINDMVFKDSLNGWGVGNDVNEKGLIIETNDGGVNWNVEVNNLSDPLTTIYFKDGFCWAAGENGLILRTEYGTSWIDQNTGDIFPSKYALKQNYPNPFNPLTTIEFDLPKAEFVTLKVYNILGEEIKTLVNNKLQAGNHTFEFDGSILASGIYLYKIKAGNWQDVKKMILIK